MKTFLPRLVLGMFLLASVAQMSQAQTSTTAGISFFKGNWDQLLAEAKKTNRPFFVDMYTDWCGWCKKMDKDAFANGEVGTYVRGNYLAYKLNAEDPAQRGPELAQKYRVQGFPTILVFSADGKLMGPIVGYRGATDFLAELKEFKQKLQ